MNAFQFRIGVAVVCSALVLAACGGGGGDGGSSSTGATGTTTTAPSSGTSTTTSSSLPPQTTVPAATYTASSAEAQVYSTINAYRQQLGVGLLRQDATLDVAAAAHAKYEQVNFMSGALSSLTHDEQSSLPGFTGIWPLNRAQTAGTAKNVWVGEEVAADYLANPPVGIGSDCVNQWINSVYHLQGMTANDEIVGVGVSSAAPSANATYTFNTCVIDLGTSTGVQRIPDPSNAADGNMGTDEGGQQFATNLIVHSPYSNEAGVALVMQAEAPNPASDVSSPGRPIMVRVNQSAGNLLTVANFQLVDGSGAAVAARILVSSAAAAKSTAQVTVDPNNLIGPGVAFLLPLAPLKAGTTYTVTFSGARGNADGSSPVAMSTTWSFTTALPN